MDPFVATARSPSLESGAESPSCSVQVNYLDDHDTDSDVFVDCETANQSMISCNVNNNKDIDEGESERESDHSTSSHDCRWNGCDRRFTRLKKMVAHVNDDHVRMEDVDYTCKWAGCTRQGKSFNARYKMLIHMRTHTKEKPHFCSTCGKRFSRLENLKIHTRSHTGEKPYVCPVKGCNKAYSNSSDRFKHTRTHFDDKPFVCKKAGCGKRYTDPSSLRKHMKTFGHRVVQQTVITSSININTVNTNVKVIKAADVARGADDDDVDGGSPSLFFDDSGDNVNYETLAMHADNMVSSFLAKQSTRKTKNKIARTSGTCKDTSIRSTLGLVKIPGVPLDLTITLD